MMQKTDYEQCKCVDYQNMYESALGRAKDMLTKDMPDICRHAITDIFPELKESEDERMKKAIMYVLYENYTDAAVIEGVEIAEIVTWLEKQGEQKPILDFKASDWYVSKVDGKIHNTYYSVEPKFKVGDWITNGDYTWEIIEVKPLDYILQSQDGNIVDDTVSYVDEQFHLWTIKDAKDGDVLMPAKTNCPFIYRKTDNNNNLAYYYAGVDGNGNFSEGCLKNTMYHFGSVAGITPAPKEQRDLLFAKMKEAGYEWDAEKKELKKIEVSEDDERIRKAIISCCLDHGSKYKYLDVSMEEMCTWLEKQRKEVNNEDTP